MKNLKKSEINLVRPKFRKMVQDALDNGEKVPYGVIYLSDEKILDIDKNTQWAKITAGKWIIKD